MKTLNKKALLLLLVVALVLCGTFMTACKSETKDQEVVMISVQENSFGSVYVAGERLDLTNAKLVLRYLDGSLKVIPITADMISGFDTATTGEKTFSVTYDGITATVSYRVIAATIIDTPVKFALKSVQEDKITRSLEIGITSVADEKEGVYAFSFDLALVGAECGGITSYLPEGFKYSVVKEGGSMKMVVYSEDGYTKYPQDGRVCKVFLLNKKAKAGATLQNIKVSNGKKDMSVAKVTLDLND